MSFLSILKNVGHALIAVDVAAAPIVEAFDPPIGNAMNVIGQLVLKAEATLPESDGATKKAFVETAVAEILPAAQNTPAKKVAVSELIDTTVAELNAAYALKLAGEKNPVS